MPLNLRGLFGRYTSDTASVSSISVGPSTPVTLLTSNPNRIGAVIYNETGTLYVKLGTNCSANNYSHRLTANSFLSSELDNYTGIVTALKVSGTTTVQVTSY